MIEQVLIIGLAAWRVASFLVNEQGPFKVAERIRRAFGVEYDWAARTKVFPDTFAANLLSCVWCISVWLAVLFYGIWQLSPECVIVVAAMSIPPIVERMVNR